MDPKAETPTKWQPQASNAKCKPTATEDRKPTALAERRHQVENTNRQAQKSVS